MIEIIRAAEPDPEPIGSGYHLFTCEINDHQREKIVELEPEPVRAVSFGRSRIRSKKSNIAP
jgi:hypothetical protein